MRGQPPEIKARIVVLWNDDRTAEQIGDELGLTKNQVIGIVHRLKLAPHRGPNGRKGKPKANASEASALLAAVRVVEAPATVAVRDVEVTSTATIGTIASGGCRFIASDDFLARMRRGEAIYCGAAVDVPGSSWCATHRRVCFDGVRTAASAHRALDAQATSE